MKELEKLWARSEAGSKQVRQEWRQHRVHVKVEAMLPKERPKVVGAVTLAQLGFGGGK